MQQAYTLHVDEPAERSDGTFFRDSDVRQRLIAKGFDNPPSVRRGSGSGARRTTCSPPSPSCEPDRPSPAAII